MPGTKLDLSQSRTKGPLDVVAVGNALLDVLAVEGAEGEEIDEVIEKAGLLRGSMGLVDRAKSEELTSLLGETQATSGGSAANTAVGIASLGGSVGFLGKVADDDFGKIFSADLELAGVEVDSPPSLETTENGTGCCVVLVSKDAERTMATYLGAAASITPTDLSHQMLARATVVYLEGYLWDLPPAKAALRRAAEVAHENDRSVALTLSDPFCVARHRRDFLDLIRDDIDVLFGNEEEIMALFDQRSPKAALDAVEETGLLAAITRGAKGSVVMTAQGPIDVEATDVAHVIDTTGAGDLYAAGFLFGLTHGLDPSQCGRLGGLCAAEIISHFGARPQNNLADLAHNSGLFLVS